jgi:hypothetical protein
MIRRLPTLVRCLAPLWLIAAASWCPAQVTLPTMRPTSYVQLQIVSGRLTLAPRTGISRTRTQSSSSSGERRERMTIDLTALHPSVDYELTSGPLQLVIQGRNQTEFRIARELRAESAIVPFQFKQEERGEIVFEWGAGEAKRTRRFSTIWHLLLVEREAARTHLLPLLEFFRPGWNLSTSVERITESLFTAAGDQYAIPRQRWAQLVSQLSSDRYYQREKAERELLAEGRAVLSYLDALPPGTLDFEQRLRIRHIRRALTRGDDNDAPESIAAWLGADPRVWLALLNHTDLSRRKLAAEQLSRVLGEPIAYDAAAAAETRSQQIEALRARLEMPVPPPEAKGG